MSPYKLLSTSKSGGGWRSPEHLTFEKSTAEVEVSLQTGSVPSCLNDMDVGSTTCRPELGAMCFSFSSFSAAMDLPLSSSKAEHFWDGDLLSLDFDEAETGGLLAKRSAETTCLVVSSTTGGSGKIVKFLYITSAAALSPPTTYFRHVLKARHLLLPRYNSEPFLSSPRFSSELLLWPLSLSGLFIQECHPICNRGELDDSELMETSTPTKWARAFLTLAKVKCIS